MSNSAPITVAYGYGVTGQQALALLGRVLDLGIDIVKTETLRRFDGKPGYTLAQGQ